MSASVKTFIFDFDSTIFPGESLDEIIQFKLKGTHEEQLKSKQISEICNLGMSGSISMEDSLERRLAIASPDKKTIEAYVAQNKNRIEAPIQNLMRSLLSFSYSIYVVSGGFEEWIVPLLDGIVPAERIHANQIVDHHAPMSSENLIIRNKEEIITDLLEAPSHTLMIGDGATDFSVFENGLAQEFIGTFYYSGIESRKKVLGKALEYQQKCFNKIEDFLKYMHQYI